MEMRITRGLGFQPEMLEFYLQLNIISYKLTNSLRAIMVLILGK